MGFEYFRHYYFFFFFFFFVKPRNRFYKEYFIINFFFRKSGLTFSSIWGEFLVRLCLLLVTMGASAHLIVAIVKSIDDSSYIKLGVYSFILVCIFLPAVCILIYLLVKSNVILYNKITFKKILLFRKITS